MGIYFRDILLIRISRGANNCGQHSLEKNIYFIMRFSPHSQLFYFNDRLEFCEFFEWKIKRINNADLFSQPPLLIFIKGANISGGHCKTLPDSCSSVLNKMECFSVPTTGHFTFQSVPKHARSNVISFCRKLFQWAWVDRLYDFVALLLGANPWNALPDSQTHLPAFTLVGRKGKQSFGLPADPCALVWHLLAAAAALTLLKTTANVIELVCAKPQ